MQAVRFILGIALQDLSTTLKILDRMNSTNIESSFIKAEVQMTGRIIRLEQHRISRRLLHGELLCGKRYHGQPKKQLRKLNQN